MTSWELIDSKRLLSTSWITVNQNCYRLPSGKEIEDYYVVERPDFVLIVAMHNDNIVLVRQYRPGTDRTYISLPAGYIDNGESPEATATRELEEEAGLVALSSRLIGVLHPLPGYIKSFAHVVFCSNTSGVLRVSDQDEIDSVFVASWDGTLDMIGKGQIIEMQAVSAILLTKHVIGQSDLRG